MASSVVLLDACCVFSRVLEQSSICASESLFFVLMIRRPPRSTLDRSSAASDVYKRQARTRYLSDLFGVSEDEASARYKRVKRDFDHRAEPVSYTHLRAHETVLDLVCRLLLEKKTTLAGQHDLWSTLHAH